MGGGKALPSPASEREGHTDERDHQDPPLGVARPTSGDAATPRASELRGQVDRTEDVVRIGEAAEEVDGVMAVDNQLRAANNGAF